MLDQICFENQYRSNELQMTDVLFSTNRNSDLTSNVDTAAVAIFVVYHNHGYSWFDTVSM